MPCGLIVSQLSPNFVEFNMCLLLRPGSLRPLDCESEELDDEDEEGVEELALEEGPADAEREVPKGGLSLELPSTAPS